MKKTYSNLITIFFTLVILFPCIADLHALDHWSEHSPSSHCECCKILTQYNQLNLINGDAYDSVSEMLKIPHSLTQSLSYGIPEEKIASPDFIYNKPPPRLKEYSFTIVLI